jgi:hypothetical protein
MSKMEKIKNMILEYLNLQKKVEFNISELEESIIHEFDSLNEYEENGGYELFYSIIKELEMSTMIVPVKSSIKITNSRKTPLSIRWRKVRVKAVPTWTEQQIIHVSDRLDLNYYMKYPDKQNESTWKDILSIYAFLKESHNWQWESKASRSYQLFQDEKFLNEEGKHLLSRLKLSENDLKIESYGEPFSYFVHPQIFHFSNIKSVLVIENLSFFHACRRLFKMNERIVGMNIDMIIYAEGTHIESSIKYLNDILEHNDFHIYYVGDMDPSGYSIYARLKMKNPQYSIKLAKSIYYKMVDECNNPPRIHKDQPRNNAHFIYFIEEMGMDNTTFISTANRIWNENRRIPQEVLPIDLLLKGECQQHA